MLVLKFMPVGQLPEWLMVEQRIEQLKDVIHSCIELDQCVPTQINEEFNKLIEKKRNLERNFDGQAAILKEEVAEEPTFKQKVLNLINERLKLCEQEHAHPTVHNQYAFLYNTISKWKG
jgi:hypothetical protein